MGTALQWRKFNFFDVKHDVDGGKLSEVLKDIKITCTTSGRGIIYFGDSDGFIYSVNRQFQISTFRAHDNAVHIILALNNSTVLLTVQNELGSVPSEIKVWAPERITSQGGTPICLRSIKPDPRPGHSASNKTNPGTSSPKVTAISLHPNNALLAIGFSDGSIMLYRGDVRRERGSKCRVIVNFGNSPVTNLHLKHSVRGCHLFATTLRKTFCINCSTKDKESTVELDDAGCTTGCSTLADSKHEHELLIARKDAIYTYTTDSKASCYVFEGQKISLSWFKGHLIVVSREEGPTSSRFSEVDYPNVLTVYDPANKLISLSTEVEGFVDVLGEWGGLYVIVSGPQLWHLSEKDLQSKFELLFKKNQFDIAINLAKLQCCDDEEISEILKQYGDWLYQKGNALAAMNQYIKTIPHLEPSYVIKKFLDTQHIDNLTTYLQALHKSGHANSDHTTLMLNCYTRLRDSEQLDNFIMQGDVDCDVELGIKVCRGAGYVDHALALASKHGLHLHYISMLIEDKKDYGAALKYISGLDLHSAKENVLLHGSSLLDHIPEQTTQLLITLCTNFNQNTPKTNSEGPMYADPEEFDYLLIGHSDVAIEFLEKVRESRPLSKHLNTTLLAELLHQYSSAPEGQDQISIEEKILKMLQSNADADFDRDHALLLCDKHKFFAGKMLLWEQAGMFQELLTWYAEQGDFDSLVDVCDRHADANRSLWCSALRFLTAETSAFPPSTELLNKVLTKIDECDLMPALEVVDLLTSSPHITLGQIRDYLLQVVEAHSCSLDAEASVTESHRQDTEKVKEKIRAITHDTIEFTGTKCDICNNNLELPTVHFLCRHSFHVHCFESYSEFESECSVCYPETKKLGDAIAMQERNANRHDVLQEQLDKAPDPFSVVADFVGKGAFTRQNDLIDLNPSPMTTKAAKSPKMYSGSIKNTRIDSADFIKDIAVFDSNSQTSEGHIRAAEFKGTASIEGVGGEGRLRMNERRPERPLEKTSEGRLRQLDPSKAASFGVTEGHLRSGIQVSSPRANLRGPEPRTHHDSISSSVVSAVPRKPPNRATGENPFEMGAGPSPAPQRLNPFEDDFETEESGPKNPFTEDYDYDESKNPFSEQPESPTKRSTGHGPTRPTLQRKTDNPFQDDYDPSLNPFQG